MPTVPKKNEEFKDQPRFFKEGQVAEFAAEMAKSETLVLNTHLEAGRKINPSLAARIGRMQTKTGLPPSVVNQNLEQLEIQDNTNNLPVDFWKKSPLTSQYIRDNSPFYAGMSNEEILNMGNTESLLAKNPNIWRKPKRFIEKEAFQMARKRFDRFTKGGGATPTRGQFEIGPDPIELDEEQSKFVFSQMVEEATRELEFEEDFIGSDAPIGAVESLQKRFSENSTFMLPFVGAVGDFARLKVLFDASSSVQDGSATESQIALLVRYGRLAEASERRGQSVLGMTASIASEIPAFAIELGSTGGVFTAGKKLTKEGLEFGLEKLLRTSIGKVLKRKLPASIGKFKDFAVRNTSRVVGTLLQSGASGPGRIAANTVQAMTPIGQTQFGEDGSVSFQIAPNTGKGFSAALTEGVFRQFSEVFTEKLGGPLSRAFAKTRAGKFLSKSLKLTGDKASALQAKLHKLGIHGVFAEMGEEEVNKFMLHIGGFETYRLPTLKELKAQALAFGAPVVATGTIGLAFDRGTNSLSETYLEDLAESVEKDATIIENSPIEYMRMIHESVKGTDKETVDMPIEQFNQLFEGKVDENGKPINPRDIVAEVMGDTKAYDEAMETGGDISIPMEEYALTLNQSDFAEEIRKISKFSPLDVTSAETERILDELEANVLEEEEGLEDMERRAQAALSALNVADNIRSQFDETSPKFDAVAADAYATLYERVFRTLGLRTGQDPLELFEKFQLKISEVVAGKAKAKAEGQEISRDELDATIREENQKLETATQLKEQTLRDLQDPEIETDAVAAADVVKEAEKQERASKRAIKEAEKRSAELEKDGEESKVFFQDIPQARVVRGNISFGTNHEVNINLFEKANLTTFLHESGHFFLELMKDLSSQEGAIESVVKTDSEGRVELKVSDILNNLSENSPRPIKEELPFGKLANVREETKKNGGVIEEPIRLGVTDSGELTIIDGRTRIVLAEELGIETLSVKFNEAQSLSIKSETSISGIAEDFQRVKDWFKERPIEEVLAEIEKETKSLERSAKSNDKLKEQAKAAREASDMAHEGGREFMNKFIDSFGDNVDPQHWGILMTPYHEQWARGFEMYLADPNNSPVRELNGLFHRFRQWIVNAYRDLRKLNVNLSADIKDVMDRLLATSEEIEESQADQGMVPLFPDPRAVGMTEDDAERYQKDIGDAYQKAHEELSAKAIELDLRKKKKAWRDRKKVVQPQVEAEANEMRVYKALANMQRGKNADGSELDSGVFQVKLDKADLLDAIGPERLQNLPRPFIYTPKDGIDLATASTMFGYESAENMLLEIELSIPKKQFIKEETDRRLHEEFGDPLSPDILPEEVDKAIHNEKRSQFLKKELDHLVSDNFATFAKLTRKITRPIPTIKEVRVRAEEIIAAKEVGKVKPIIYKRGEAKSSKAAIDAMLKSDFEAAFEAKKLELLNHELFRAATAAVEEIGKDLRAFRPIRSANKKATKVRDMGFVNAAQGILGEYGLGKPGAKTLDETLKFLRTYGRADQADVLTDLVATTTAIAKPYKESTLEQFRLMASTVKSLWKLSRATKQMQIKDKKISVEDAAAELAPLLAERKQFKDAPDVGTIFGKFSKRGIKRGVIGWKSSLTRVESWVRGMDKGSPTGPFRRFIWNPIIQGVSRSNAKSAEFIKEFQDHLGEIEGDITRTEINAFEIGFKFRDKAQLLGALLHIGNDSNLSKLLRGRDWGRFDENRELNKNDWERFRRRMEDAGILTKKDYEFLQKTWDLFEKTKVDAQKAHFDLYGFGFNEITANSFETKYGTFRGGYAPAVIDYMELENINEMVFKGVVRDSELDDLNNSFMYPTTSKGFIETRDDDYARPLQLNLELVPMHISKVMRFSFIEAPVRDVHDLIKNQTFRDAMNSFDPSAILEMLDPWLERTARQRISTPSEGMFGGRLMDSVWRAIRKRSSQSIMFVSVVNALQQFTGVAVAATKIKPRYLRNSYVEYMKNWKTFAQDISDKSEFMSTRNTTSVIEQLNNIEDIVVKPGPVDSVRQFADKHALFLQIATQGFVDNIVWNGAYNQGIQRVEEGGFGLSEEDAVLHGDSMVRETQGGFSAEQISRAETGTPFQKMFLTFYGYFNMLANTLGTEFSIAFRTTTGFNRQARFMYIYLMGVMIPAVVAESISVALRGDFDEDDDEEYLDDFIGLFFSSQIRTATATVPGGGVAQSIFNKFNDKWYDDRISLSPAVSQLERAGKAFYSVPDAIFSEGRKSTALKDSSAVFNLLFGIPTGQVGKTGGFFLDLAEGEQEADGFLEITKGIIGGRSNP